MINSYNLKNSIKLCKNSILYKMDLKIILLKFLIYKMAQEESWECPVTTNGKYVNALLKNIHH